MLFSHISDTHLGLVQYGSNEREQDVYDVFNQAIDKSIALHGGPNALDSKSEIAAMEGDYQKAFNNQFKARDFAFFASPYDAKLRTYWRTVNKDDLSNYLKDAQSNDQGQEQEKKEIKKKSTTTSAKEKKPATKKAKSKPAGKKTKKVSKK